MTITFVATPQPSNDPPRVLLELEYTGQTSATVTRLDPDGRTRLVRLADPATLVAGLWTGFDYESFFSASCTYTATTGAGTVTTSAVSLNVDDVWLRHPGVPSLSLQVDFQGDDKPVRPVTQAILEPLGRREPIVVTDARRKSKRGTMTLRTQTLPQAEALLALVDDVAVLLLDVPPGKLYGITHEYRALGDLTEGRLIEDWYPHPWRIWTAPFVVVGQPAGGQQAERTWADVMSGSATWADVIGTYDTWNDVLTGTT